MASAFGDQSYSKLPPIRKGSLKDSQDLHGEKDNSSHEIDFNREGHGLVRLPPIIRIDSSAPSGLNAATQNEIHDDLEGNPPRVVSSGNKDSFTAASRRFSSDQSFKQKPQPPLSGTKLNETRRTDELKSSEEYPSRCTSVENTRDSLLIKKDSPVVSTILRSEIDTIGEQNRDHIKAPALLSTRLLDHRTSRRSSLVTTEPQKLHRGRRLAKSSPELSSTRKKYDSPIRRGESKGFSKGSREIEWIAASGSGSADSRQEQLQFDISANVFSKDQGNPASPRDRKAKGIVRRAEIKHKANYAKGDFFSHSSPSTPVVQLTEENGHISDREGRQSLGDINNIISPQRARKISIVSTRKKLPIRDEIKKDSLRVDGKRCPKSERLKARTALSSRTHPPSRDGFLRLPESKAKRESVYDLQQILAMLNKEDRLANSSDATTRENRSPSVYDLKEFLKMSPYSEPAPTATSKKTRNLNLPNADNVESLAVPGVIDPENRRGSTYNLLEFLSLNFAAAKSKDNGQDGREILRTPSTQPANSSFLGSGDNEDTLTDVRRSSAYDLMEFLSLSGLNQNNEVTNTEGTSPIQPSLKLPVNLSPQDEPRKNSVYDLEEFLKLTKALPTGSRVSESEAPVEHTPFNSSLLSPTLPSKFKFKRESIYDLQEFLGILQKEADVGPRNASQVEDKTAIKANVNPGIIPRQDSTQELESSTPLDTHPEPQKSRSLSVYDLREFLSIYTAGQTQPTATIPNRGRKASSISQSSIMINVSEDEFGNGSVDDIFLAVPIEGNLARKRSSVSELSELLNVLNDPSRKRIPSNPSSAKSSISDRSSVPSPSPVSRHDSGGAKSLYDLGEFLNMLNSDDSPLRRRLSSVSDRGNRSPSGLSRNDSSGGSSLYDLEEFLTMLNENGKEESESKREENNGQEICIPVPQLPSRTDRNGNERMTLMKRASLTAQCSTGLNSLSESTDIAG